MEHSHFKDIFLDFANRDSREIAESFRVFAADAHVSQLRQMLVLAAFMCRDCCIMPPGFAAEDPLVRRALSALPELLDSRLVRWPIRESLDEYWSKKEAEYRTDKVRYRGLFDRSAQEYVDRYSHLLIDRTTKIGSTIVNSWEAAPDVDPYWRARTFDVPPGIIEIFRAIPRNVQEDGRAVTWSEIARQAATIATTHPEYRRLVQRVYFDAYIREFDLEVIRNQPFAHLDLGLGGTSLFYSYDAIALAVGDDDLWRTLLSLSAPDVLRVRREESYYSFRDKFYALCASARTFYELKERLSHMAGEERPSKGLPPLSVPGRQLSFGFHDHDDEWIEGLALRLEAQVDPGYQRLREHEARQDRGRSYAKIARAQLERKGPRMKLGVFVALKEERDVLIKRWQLDLVPGTNTWTGPVGDANVTLYSTGRMGRVPAAVATAAFLVEPDRKLDLLLVCGLAGGFAEADNIAPGVILVPRLVADLAEVKIADAWKARPAPFEVDVALGQYLEADFGERTPAWEATVSDDAGWPRPSRPYFLTGGVLACADSVVANDEERARLLEAWPKVEGIDMESGGVIPAARQFGKVPVAVLRAISDMADPLKGDDGWRRRGMIAIAHLVATIEWAAVQARMNQ